MASSSSSSCAYCAGPNAPHRCAQCKQVNYCSRECQQSGWKTHKKACRAWGELSNHVQTLPLEEAHRRFQQAQNTIQKLEEMVEEEAVQEVPNYRQKKQSSKSANASPRSVRESGAPAPAVAKSLTKKESPMGKMLPQNISTKPPPRIVEPVTIHPDWNCTMEELIHLDSYQVTLRLKTKNSKSIEVPEVQLRQADTPNATRITIGDDLLSWILPAVVSDYRVARLPNHCLSIRFQCTPDTFVVPFYNSPATTLQIEQLVCKSCNSQLLSANIDRVVPLPSGYWDEITDYIQCYPGEAVVDFGTTIVPPSCAWEDAHVFVLNSGNVKDVAITTLPSVDPYGTSNTELLSWQPEGRQVETLCCSYCCAALGVVTNQGYHLYKHRLLLTQEQDTAAVAAAPVSIFIANELKRYAESQATFTFVVVAASSATSKHNNKDKISCLLLHVLSWDSTMLAVMGGREERAINFSRQQKKKRVVKLIYEETSQLPAFHREEISSTSEDITSWSWGGLDLCCNPGDIATTTKAKSVVLTLEDDEFTELLDSIRSSPYYFPQQVVDAMIMVKLGIKEVQSKAIVGMAALDLI